MKSRVTPSSLTLASLACSLLFACGSVDTKPDDGATGGAGPVAEGPLLPWVVGNQWTYRITDAGVVSLKTTTVGELEEVGGLGPNAGAMAYHVITAKGADLKDRTESWQAPSEEEPTRIVRFREQAFDASSGNLELEESWDPPKLHIDGAAERTVTGASWLESYAETKLPVGLSPSTHNVRERWTVIDDNETVEVPAGTFEHAIHLQKVGGSSTKDYWYVHGVGKVKETGGQTEELTEYDLEAAP
jgi:hypothetical protein